VRKKMITCFIDSNSYSALNIINVELLLLGCGSNFVHALIILSSRAYLLRAQDNSHNAKKRSFRKLSKINKRNIGIHELQIIKIISN
jgi:hypothetical protein